MLASSESGLIRIVPDSVGSNDPPFLGEKRKHSNVRGRAHQVFILFSFLLAATSSEPLLHSFLPILSVSLTSLSLPIPFSGF